MSKAKGQTNGKEVINMKKTTFKRVYDKMSLGFLKLEVFAIMGVVAVCFVKAGTLFLI